MLNHSRERITTATGNARLIGIVKGLLHGSLIAILASCGASSKTTDSGPVSPGAEPPGFVLTQAYLPNHPESFERFGAAVALSDEYVVISALGSQYANSPPRGVYVYSAAAARTEAVRLPEPGVSPGSLFGGAVAIERETIVVGAAFDAADGARAGAVYIYEVGSDGWAQTARLTSQTGKERAYFGESVAANGDTIAVGAPGPGDGAVYVFQRSSEGWAETARLLPETVDPDARFGSSLAMTSDSLAVGSWTTSETLPGRVYLFARDGGEWRHDWTFESPDFLDRFGYSLDLSESTLVVGAPGIDASGVHVFERQDGGWNADTILRPPAGGSFGFGTAVGLGDGFLLVAAPTAGSTGAGEIFVYRVQDGRWASDSRLTSPEPQRDREFGASLAATDKAILAGAPGFAEAFHASGAAYRFLFTDGSESQNGSSRILSTIASQPLRRDFERRVQP